MPSERSAVTVRVDTTRGSANVLANTSMPGSQSPRVEVARVTVLTAEAGKLEAAKKALESGSASQCTEALEKIAVMGKILSEVILYDPGTFSADQAEAEPSGEA